MYVWVALKKQRHAASFPENTLRFKGLSTLMCVCVCWAYSALQLYCQIFCMPNNSSRDIHTYDTTPTDTNADKYLRTYLPTLVSTS